MKLSPQLPTDQVYSFWLLVIFVVVKANLCETCVRACVLTHHSRQCEIAQEVFVWMDKADSHLKI